MMVMMPFAFMGVEHQDMLKQIPVPVERMIEPLVPAVSEPIQQQVPAPGFEDVPEMIVETENNCDSSYPDICIPSNSPDLDCGEIRYSNFRVIGSDPHGFDGDGDGIGCES